MYLRHFHLREEPFATTPDPRFLYKSAVHQEALDRIMTSVASRRGINAIIGEPGLGKSMLIRTLLKGFNDKVRFAWVFNTTMNSRELLRYICRDFGFTPKGEDLGDLLIELYTFLIREYEQGRFTLLIIDEAQNLKPEVLEEIRQLSNLETASQKLLQVILSGQPQLDRYLNDPALVQLKQRISLKATLHRLNETDTAAYIRHRLKVAGARKQEIFTAAALQVIFEVSDGIPRLINQVCDNALMAAAAQKVKQIDAALILDLVQEDKVMTADTTPAAGCDPEEKPAAICDAEEEPAAKAEGESDMTVTGSAAAAAADIVERAAGICSAPAAGDVDAAPARKRPRLQPAVELEFAAGFDGLDLGELSIF
ncbi:MAG TPA: AAA family ATPase [bacterium]|nr:AAA family ATPase [bacterium]